MFYLIFVSIFNFDTLKWPWSCNSYHHIFRVFQHMNCIQMFHSTLYHRFRDRLTCIFQKPINGNEMRVMKMCNWVFLSSSLHDWKLFTSYCLLPWQPGVNDTYLLQANLLNMFFYWQAIMTCKLLSWLMNILTNYLMIIHRR